MSQLSDKTLKLLVRPPVKNHILHPKFFTITSLLEDIELHCSSSNSMSVKDTLNILIKYFHAYIYPDSSSQRISLSDISTCFNQFIHRRVGSELLWGKKELRLIFLKYGFALAMLADLAKSAHIFQEIANQKINPQKYGNIFLGADIGTGTGILMLAQMISARKNRFREIEITGIERESNTLERTQLLTEILNTGKVIGADAKKVQTYSFFQDRPVTFISNETLPGSDARLWKEDFIAINKVLFENFAPLFEKTLFFPSKVFIADKSGKNTQILCPENQFHQIQGYPLRLMYPLAIELDGKPVHLVHIGNHITSQIQDPWPEILSHRW